MFFSVYSYANIFLCVVAGYFIDKIGARFSFVFFCGIMAIGHFVFYLSSIRRDYTMALIGRFIFGIGSECQQVTFFMICGIWFKQKELALATAFGVMSMKIGMSTADFMIPQLFKENHSVPDCLFVGMGFLFASFLSACAYFIIDKHNEKQLEENRRRKTETEEIFHLPDQNFTMDHIRSLSGYFWWISIFGFLNYCTFSPYYANYVALVQTRFNFSMQEAGKIVSLPIMLMTLFTPLFGWMSDKINRRGFFLSCGQLFIIFSHLFMASIKTKKDPLLPAIAVACNAVGYVCFVSSIYPTLTAVLNKGNLGFGIGLYTSFQNISYAVSPMAIGFIIDKTSDVGGGFYYVNIYCGILSILAIFVIFCLTMYDKFNSIDQILNGGPFID